MVDDKKKNLVIFIVLIVVALNLPFFGKQSIFDTQETVTIDKFGLTWICSGSKSYAGGLIFDDLGEKLIIKATTGGRTSESTSSSISCTTSEFPTTNVREIKIPLFGQVSAGGACQNGCKGALMLGGVEIIDVQVHDNNQKKVVTDLSITKLSSGYRITDGINTQVVSSINPFSIQAQSSISGTGSASASVEMYNLQVVCEEGFSGIGCTPSTQQELPQEDTIGEPAEICNTQADTDCNGEVSLGEVNSAISSWINGQMTRTELGKSIQEWSKLAIVTRVTT